jgi:hypothetical protein
MFIRPLYWDNEWPQFQYVPPVSTLKQSSEKSIVSSTRTRLVLSTVGQSVSLFTTNGSSFYSITGAEIKPEIAGVNSKRIVK